MKAKTVLLLSCCVLLAACFKEAFIQTTDKQVSRLPLTWIGTELCVASHAEPSKQYQHEKPCGLWLRIPPEAAGLIQTGT